MVIRHLRCNCGMEHPWHDHCTCGGYGDNHKPMRWNGGYSWIEWSEKIPSEVDQRTTPSNFMRSIHQGV